MLHFLLRVIETRLRQRSGWARGRLGAVSFVQRFGGALNAHVHFRCCVIDGVFVAGEDWQVQFAEPGALTPQELAAVWQQARIRVPPIPPSHWSPGTCHRAPNGSFPKGFGHTDLLTS